MSQSVRVRFAPSPTGPLHLGGVRTALYNYLFARKNNGKFILRIEDTDQNRYVEGAENYIKESLLWTGMQIDEGPDEGGEYGPYRQSERKHLYKAFVGQLVESGHAYLAFDTSEELEGMRERLKAQGVPNPAYNHVTRQYMQNSLSLSAEEVEQRIADGVPYVVRIKVPRNEEIRIEDEIRGWVVFNSSQIDDKVIFKADGMPTYHLANVVDDYLMKITHVIRGEEWLPSTPVHVLLYRFLGWEEIMPTFAHLPLILKPDGDGKLSKRDGDRLGFPVFALDWQNPETGEKSIGFRERGFLPQAFMNMLAFLGWNPGTPQEIFMPEELIESFSLKRVSKSGAKFDYEKAKWFNQQYIKLRTEQDILESLQTEIAESGYELSQAEWELFVRLFKDRVVFLGDFLKEGKYVFEKPTAYDEKQFFKRWKKEAVPAALAAIRSDLEGLQQWTAEAVEQVVKQQMETAELKPGELMPAFRIMISGVAGGPPLFDLAYLLGKVEVMKRMDAATAYFKDIEGA